ncbi:FecR family protein [Janthinobacterium sp. UMAB-56]|uniref:FecR family protein n=1 Tax=Janthinobacterium sp. UMAB-56 TaxID=1365361 RepID=UPI00214BB196|nr:FecR family protein [Janthinobacterium sp. UMAB-56]
MMPLKKPTAIKALLWLALMCLCAHAWAGQVAGTVMQLSGPLMAKKADGKVKILAIKSEVEQGDTLLTEKETYALIKLIDNSEITLKPNSSFVIEQFSYTAEQPEGDHAIFSLLKGGLRSVTGLLGKRNKERFEMKTPAATIGIRGTTFVANYVAPSAAPSAGQGLAPGLYVQVLDGMIHVTNPSGAQNFAAGQFGFTPSIMQPPLIVPVNPGMQFTPPPAFSAPSSASGAAAGGSKAAAVDCIVR